jgi:hypothetical protein
MSSSIEIDETRILGVNWNILDNGLLIGRTAVGHRIWHVDMMADLWGAGPLFFMFVLCGQNDLRSHDIGFSLSMSGSMIGRDNSSPNKQQNKGGLKLERTLLKIRNPTILGLLTFGLEMHHNSQVALHW